MFITFPTKDSSTTPLRIMYDCSCSPNAAQPSLNSCLSTGPDILNDMTAILIRFRCYRYGITADIEKAFFAAVVGARLASYLCNQLKITHTIYWSDSQIVIHWLSSTKELKLFVKNHVNEIRKSTCNATWNYCPSSNNPANLLTR